MSNKNSAFFAFTLCLITITYGVFQARTLIHGPTLIVSSPRPGETVSTVLMVIQGKTENVTHVSVNGQPVTMDTNGTFDETFVTPEGYGVILVEAKNRFGRHQEQRIEFIGTPPQTSPQVVAEQQRTPELETEDANASTTESEQVTSADATHDTDATLL